jgi:class 3 adenylate cyclase
MSWPHVYPGAAAKKRGFSAPCSYETQMGDHSGNRISSSGAEGRAESRRFGETPNIAARIQAEASPGEIAISDSLRRILPERRWGNWTMTRTEKTDDGTMPGRGYCAMA